MQPVRSKSAGPAMSSDYDARPHWYRPLLALALCALLVVLISDAGPASAATVQSETYGFVTEWGPEYSGYALFQGTPTGVAADGDGNVYVVDIAHDVIEKRTSDGEVITQWGSTGSGPGQFDWAQGIAVDGAGNVYVADTFNNRIQKFTSGGVFVTQWGGNGSAEGQFAGLWDVAVGPDGSVYVSDTGNDRIQKFTSSGVFLTSWGESGTGQGEFQFPRGITVDASGHVYVVDVFNNRIQKFTSEGAFVAMWGELGSAESEFIRPTGIAAGADGFVYVTDSSNYRVQKFTAAGAFVATWGLRGETAGEFEEPAGIAVAPSGHVYVADSGLDSIQKFSPTGGLVAAWLSTGSAAPNVFEGPLGLAVDNEGFVWASDGKARNVLRFVPDGTQAALWRGGFEDPFLIWGLKDVAADQDGYVHVLDTYLVTHYDQYGNPSYKTTEFRVQKADQGGTVVNSANVSLIDEVQSDACIAVGGGYAYVVISEQHKVYKLDASGVVAEWGSEGSGSGQFNLPHGVAVGPDGSVYIADSANHRIQRFTANGVFVSDWGSYGSEAGEFYGPSGIAVDGDGDVFVTDAGNHRVQKFSGDGVFLTAWGSDGTGPGEFRFPISIAVDAEDNVYVADEESLRIQKFAQGSVNVNTIDLQHDAAGVTFDRWVTGYSTSYSGGGYVYGRWAGTRLDAKFTGAKIRWVGPKQPAYGMADVYIDDVLVAENVDCYAPAGEATLSTMIWESEALPDGPHTLSIRLTGAKNPASGGYYVVIDRFEVTGAAPSGGGMRIDDSLAAPGYTGTWLHYINPTYFNKTYAYSRWTNAAFTATFTGTKVSWIGPRTTNYGIADVYIDGAKVATVDTYRPNLAIQGWREVVWESGTLSAGEHTIAIKPLGTKNPAATAANVVIDAIDVRP